MEDGASSGWEKRLGSRWLRMTAHHPDGDGHVVSCATGVSWTAAVAYLRLHRTALHGDALGRALPRLPTSFVVAPIYGARVSGGGASITRGARRRGPVRRPLPFAIGRD